MRVLITILICVFLSACSTRPNSAALSGGPDPIAPPKTYLVDSDGKTCPHDGCPDAAGPEPEQTNPEENDNVFLKAGKTVFFVAVSVVAIGLLILSKIPAGAY